MGTVDVVPQPTKIAATSDIKRIFIDFLNDYKAQKLDQGYYLEFNNMSSTFSPVYNFMKVLVPLAQIINREVM